MKKKSTIILLITFIFILLISNNLNAIPAYPFPIEFIQPDGSKINILLKGDEKVKWAETIDGYSLMFNKTGTYEYATLDTEGNMLASGRQAKNKDERSTDDIIFLSQISKGITYTSSQISMMKSIWNIQQNEAQKAFPTTGNRNLVCILIGFTDLAFTKTQSEFNNLFNQLNYTTDAASGSVKDYYNECSYGQLNLSVTIAGPYIAANNMAYYGANDVSGNDAAPQTLAAEAVTLANSDINFANFDNDVDGYVDGVYVIYAGFGEEAGASSNAIWAHAWNLSSTLYLDGKYISKYSCSPELRGNSGTSITRIGVICHEFGHVLGAPDYYDTDYSTGGQYDGTGYWDMMASGSWNNNGATPAHHNVYTKTKVYNWAVANILNSGSIITLNNAEQNSNSFYQFNTTTANEYYLIENRQQQLFDTYIPGKGMLIYHVDGSYISTAGNAINAGSHQGMYPVCANATGNPTSTYGTINGTSCPFPGTGLKSSFTDATTPWAKSWAGANTSKPITSIIENNTNKTVTFTFMGGSSCTAPTTQASNFTATNLASTTVTIGWTRGNGNNVIVIAKAAGSVDTDPVSGTSYTANTVFGLGNQIGVGNFVVYNGSSTSTNITGLTPGVIYSFAIYEYASTSSCYLIPGLTGNATTPCGTISTFPYSESFANLTIPSCYIQQNIGIGLTDMWTISQANNAGGTANELKATYQNINPGTSRLILNPINTINISSLNLTFKHYYDDYGSGLNYKIQVSNDMINWVDAGWTNASGLGNYGPTIVNLSITQKLNNATTYIAFVLDGNLYYYDFWFIDDINITAVQAINATLNVSTTSLPSFGNVNQYNNSSTQYFGVSGSGLASNITITAPSNFLVSTNCSSGFSQSVNITPSSGNVPYTRVWVKFNPNYLGPLNLNISVATSGVTTKTVAISGTCISSGIPSNYYSTATGSGALLKNQLHNIIKTHTKRSYTNLWTDFQSTDKKYNGKVWDMYSDKPCDSNYEFTFITNQCGTYSAEAGCYNREHSLPNSWWGGTTDTMYSDLMTLVPTDGYVNNMRSNYTFGKVATPNWTSTNGSKRGPCTYPGYTGTQANVFEPIDEYKGDFARIYLYMATRYENRISLWPSFDANAADCFAGNTYPGFKTWQLNLLLEWHNNDPVSQKEINRNNAVYSIQGNRNPFIDNPLFVAQIWQSKPLVNTLPSTNIAPNSVTCIGNILSEGSSAITESGIIYSITPNPVIGGSGVVKISSSPLVSIGNYTINITGLTPITTYYARAYAINSQGTSYGSDVMFTTEIYLPIVSTDSVINITATSASAFCTLNQNQFGKMLFTGIVYSEDPNPFSGDPGVITALSNPLDTIGNYSINLTSLSPGTTYYLKAYASNEMGQSYGNEFVFSTPSCITQTLPYTQNFETTFPPIGWSVINPDGNKTWANKLVLGKQSGTDSAAYINFYSYGTTYLGQTDDLISPAFDFTTSTNPKLVFNVSYRYYSSTSLDTLKIYYSTDCGGTYNALPIYVKGGVDLSTGGLLSTNFTPSLSSDWRQEIVNLSFLAGSNNVKLKFQAVNDYGNNLYIDDIQIIPDGYMKPTVFTYSATVLNADTVIIYGRVNANGLPTSVQFNYGTSLSYSNTITSVPNNASGDTNTNVYQYLIGLPTSSTFNYQVSATNSLGTSYGNNVIFSTPCAIQNLPIIENFNNLIRPNCWTSQNSSGLSDKWSISSTSNAGGTSNELKLTYQLLNGTTRFVSPAFNTIGKSLLKLTFKHYFDDFTIGTNFKIQSSTDAINWTNENYSFSSGSGNIGPTETSVSIYYNLNSPTTYLAFVASDSLGKFDYWYIDNIVIEDYLPNPNFYANKLNTCFGDSITFTNTSSGSSITSYLWNFGNGAIPQTATGIGPHTVKYSNSGSKSISLTLNGQYVNTKTNYVNIQSLAIGGQINGVGNICVGQSTGNMTLNNYNGNILKWQKRYNNGVWIDITNTNASYSEVLSDFGFYEYRAEVSAPTCNSIFSDIYSIEAYRLPIAGNITSDKYTICNGDIVNLSIDSYLGNIQWQESANGTSGWTDITSGNGYNSANYTSNTISSNKYFRAVVVNGNCSPIYSNVINILINGNPIAGTASTTINSICYSGNTSLNLNGSSGSVQWEFSSDSINWNQLNGANSSVYNVISLTQTTYYRAKISINNCYVYSNIVKINVSPIPIAGSISVQGSPMCGGNSAVLTLNNSVGNVQWLQSPNGSGNWTEVATGSGFNSTTLTTSNLYSTTYYRAKVSSGNCGIVYSQISNINVYPQVVGGTATVNSNVCSGSSTIIYLIGSSGNIIWQQTTDTNSTWQNVTGGSGNNTTSYTTPLLYTNVFYRAKLSGTLCPDAYSNIISININSPSIAGEINSANPTICEGNSANLTLTSYNGSIQWQESVNGVDNWSDLNSGIGYNSEIFTSTQLSSSVYYRVKVTNGSCGSIFTNPYLINVDMTPLAGSISPIIQSLCYGNNISISLSNSFGNIQWQESSDGNTWSDISATNGSGMNSTVYNSPLLFNNSFYRAKVSNGICPSVNSLVSSINITPLPNSGVATVGNNNFCSGGISSINLANYSGNIQWQQSIDSITWSNVTSGNGSTTAIYTTAALNQSTFFRAQLTSGSCVNYSNVVKINVFPLAVAGSVSVNGTPMCSGNSATLSLNNSIGNVQWLQSPNGSGNWTNVITGNGFNSTMLQTSNLNTTTFYRARLTSGNCPVVFSPISNVFVYTQPNGGNASASATQICVSGTTTLNLSSYTGSIIWEQSSDSTNWSNASGGNGANSANYTTPVITANRFYRAKLSNGICLPAYSNIVSINVNSLSIAGNIVTTEDTICQNSSTQLQTTAYQGLIQWQYSDNSISWNDIIDANSSVYQTELLTNSAYYRTKLTNGSCAAVYSNPQYIKVDEQTSSGVLLLAEDTLCFGSTFNLNLSAYQGNISWQQSSDEINWQIINNQNAANYSNTAIENKYFRTIVSSGVCPQLTSNEVYIVVKEELNGGIVEGNKTICFGNTTQNLVLKNYSGNITKWQKNYNNGDWVDIIHTDTMYSEIPDSAGVWIYRAVLDNYPCQTAYSEAATINVVSISNASTISGSKNLCYGNSTDTLISDAQNQYIVKWQKRFNDDNWMDIPNSSQLNKYEETPTTSGKWEYRTVISNSVCDTIFSLPAIVNIYPLPIINAGSDLVVCKGDSIILNATGGNIYVWNNGFVQGQKIATDSSEIFIVTANDFNNCSNTDTLNVMMKTKTINLKLFLQGLYAGNSEMNSAMNENGHQFGTNIADRIIIEIRDSISPFVIIDTLEALVSTNGTYSKEIDCSLNSDYYIVINSRNHIRTWSAIPISFASDTVSFDFTDFANKAFGENMKLTSDSKWSIYAGDINQDGLIDGSDVSGIETSNNNFDSGYLITDINGDGLIDGSDMSIVETNNNAFVGEVSP